MTSTSEAFLDDVREANRTALSRLGSSKALYADTKGEMEADAVLAAAATAERAAHDTYADWADSEDGAVADAFAETAEEEQSHYDTVVDELGEDPQVELDGVDPGDLPAIQAYLRDLDSTVARVGGFAGRTLAAAKSKDQLVGFFVGQADPQTAQTFREMNADLDDQLDRVAGLLEQVCETDDDWQTAHDAASGAIQAAYEEYTERLEGMGVNPKPVC